MNHVLFRFQTVTLLQPYLRFQNWLFWDTILFDTLSEYRYNQFGSSPGIRNSGNCEILRSSIENSRNINWSGKHFYDVVFLHTCNCINPYFLKPRLTFLRVLLFSLNVFLMASSSHRYPAFKVHKKRPELSKRMVAINWMLSKDVESFHIACTFQVSCAKFS